MLDLKNKTINNEIVKQLTSVGDAVAGMGLSFSVFDQTGNILLHRNSGFESSNHPGLFARIEGLFKDMNSDLISELSHDNIFALPINLGDEGKAIAVVENHGEDTNLSGHVCQLVKELLAQIEKNIKSEQQIGLVSTELADTYEELVLLYKMSSNMKVSQADSNYLQLACDWLTELVNVEGIAILLERQIGSHKRLVLTAGAGLIDVNQQLVEQLHARLLEEVAKDKDALLDSDVDGPCRYTWPGRIRNIIAVPLEVNQRITGLMVAINRIDKPDFDSTDVKMFNSVAHQCAIFIENGRLFKDLKGLLVGSLKALTTSIDAKDQYTRGHSERVAFIAKWIAEKLAETQDIDEDFIHKIYLAGLLHDIGKIGIPEGLLRKKGKLTNDEMLTIKSHPSIGASILSEIKQMQEIIPGILYHHERFDGKGYPNNLSDDRIHMIGKIISVADSFDAMTSKRTYRDAMSLQAAADEIRKASGTQFDPVVTKAFLESDLYALWNILHDGSSPVWGSGDLVEFSTEAVGALIK